MSGALNWRELYSLAKQIGFEIPRTVTGSPIEITRPDLKAVVGLYFTSHPFFEHIFNHHFSTNLGQTIVVLTLAFSLYC